MRTIIQCAEHSSPLRENLHLTGTTRLMDGRDPVLSLFFPVAHVLFAREQNGNRGAGAGSFTDERRMRGFPWQQ